MFKFAVRQISVNSALILMLGGCGKISETVSPPSEIRVDSSSSYIMVNQLGFLPDSPKIAVVPAVGAMTFDIISTDGHVVFSGPLSSAETWEVAGESIKRADFSELKSAGEYRVSVAGLKNSAPFSIGEDIYSTVHDAAIKAYYFNRASTALEEKHAGVYARPAGHPDTEVMIHQSAASQARPTGTKISAPKGWYDAGDYGKYIVNSGISTYTLLTAYQHFPGFYQNRELTIPESGNQLPDLLDEILWNLDWMEAMQDSNDGGVYHKLTTLRFSGEIMPHEGTEQRYVVQKGTGATLNFAAVMAQASRVFARFDSERAKRYLSASQAAWNWAKAHPEVIYQQPEDVRTGAYGDSTFNDEFGWAAAELFLATEDKKYLDEFFSRDLNAEPPGWNTVQALGYISLAKFGQPLLTAGQYSDVIGELILSANKIVESYNDSAFRVPMEEKDFVWGSNGVAMNRAMIALQAYQLTGKQAFKDAAIGLVDYIFGRNPTHYSYVSGFGDKPVIGIHHRPSEADGIDAPVPGFVSGGAQSRHNPDTKTVTRPDGCDYPSRKPAKSFVDHWCSYSTNEVTINWNAPLVYTLAALQNL